MSIWDYFRSVVIFIAATYFVNHNLQTGLVESIVLVLLMAVCVFHTMDIRDDIMKTVAKKRAARKGTFDARENGLDD